MNPARVLFELDEALQAAGLPPMDAATLREAHQHLQHPQVAQAMQSGQLTTQGMAQNIVQMVQGLQRRQRPGGPFNQDVMEPNAFLPSHPTQTPMLRGPVPMSPRVMMHNFGNDAVLRGRMPRHPGPTLLQT